MVSHAGRRWQQQCGAVDALHPQSPNRVYSRENTLSILVWYRAKSSPFCVNVESPMPELPEVQTVVTTLCRRKCVGRTIGASCTSAPTSSPRLTSTCHVAHGRPSNPSIPPRQADHLHARRRQPLLRPPRDDRPADRRRTCDAPMLPHTHLELDLGGDRRLRFRDPRRFGGVWWLGRDALPRRRHGPRAAEAAAGPIFPPSLHKTTRAVKNALMDQTRRCGAGKHLRR